MNDEALDADRVTQFPVSDAYRNYVLFLLFVVYVFNFVDRQILGILLQPIKEEFSLSDTQLGLLGGLAFAIFYTALGIPIARLADTYSRKKIIAVSLALWSAMTALCGAASSFTTLLLARIGVGVGEAGGSPPSHSLIADYFPPERRATALAIYALGVPVGVLVGMSLGGWINQAFGWRTAFFVVGGPGVVLALLVLATLREPPRGFAEKTDTPHHAPKLGEALRYLWQRRSFRHIPMAAGLISLAGYGNLVWIPSFLIRSHDMNTTEVGIWLGLIVGIGGSVGIWSGGFLSDRLAERNKDQRWYMRLCGYAIILSIPFYFAAFLWPTRLGALLFLLVPILLSNMWLGPSYSMVQGIAGIRMRATAAAIFLFVNNIIGLGLGPLTIGVVSDGLEPSMGNDSLRYALLGTAVIVSLWAAFHFLRAMRTLNDDLSTSVV